MKFLSTLTLTTFLLFSAQADWNQEEKKINFLLEELGKLDAVFIRNGSEHTATEAVSHLRRKLSFGLKSWFTPKKEKWTAIMFIEKLASKSSMSGRPYTIKFTDGKVVETEQWLKGKLGDYEKRLQKTEEKAQVRKSTHHTPE